MMSIATIRRLRVSALVLIALYLLIVILNLFQRGEPWIEYGMLGAGAILLIVSALAALLRRAERNRDAKATRDSLLKHIWELRHRREW